MGGRRVVGLSLALALAPGGPASATPAPAPTPAPTDPADARLAEAEALFEQGSHDYNLGRFAAAVANFERAYELSQANALLYNIAQAHAKHYEVDADPGHLRRAKVMFLNFAKIAEATGEDPRDARRRVLQLDEQLAAHEARQREAREAEARAAAARVEAERMAAERQRQADAAAYERRYRPRTLGVVGYSLLGVGLVGGLTVGSLGANDARRLGDQRDAESGLPLTAEREALYEREIGKARGLGLAGLGVGLGLVIAGSVMVAVDVARRRRGLTRRASLGAGGLTLAF